MSRLGIVFVLAGLLAGALGGCEEDDGPPDGVLLDVSVQLDADEVASGEVITGEVHVENVSDEPVAFAEEGDDPEGEGFRCEAQVAVGLARPGEVDEAQEQHVWQLDCTGAEVLVPGEVMTVSVELAAQEVVSQGPVPDLPPGEYELYVASFGAPDFAAFPEPHPFTVTP